MTVSISLISFSGRVWRYGHVLHTWVRSLIKEMELKWGECDLMVFFVPFSFKFFLPMSARYVTFFFFLASLGRGVCVCVLFFLALSFFVPLLFGLFLSFISYVFFFPSHSSKCFNLYFKYLSPNTFFFYLMLIVVW